jgi:hypothetical protein
MQVYLSRLRNTVKQSSCCKSLDLSPLQKSIDNFSIAARPISVAHAAALTSNDTIAAKVINRKYKALSRSFDSQDGLPGREFDKHVLCAPAAGNGYKAATFPES